MKLVRSSNSEKLKKYAYFVPSSDTEDALSEVINRVSRAYRGDAVYVYEIDEEALNLIQMSDPGVVKEIYNRLGVVPSNIKTELGWSDSDSDSGDEGDITTQQAVGSSFPLINDKVRRFSTLKMNNKVSEYICETLEKNGYIANKINKLGFGNGKFHEEVMLCPKGQTKIRGVKEIRGAGGPPPIRRKTK